MKDYVLVSQGVEIYRTPDESEAREIMKKSNDDWRKYCQKCYDRGEVPADNEVFLDEEDVVEGTPTTFASTDAMLAAINADNDFYNKTTGEYVFKYSESGSIAVYRLDMEEALELQKKAMEDKQYWGAYLGPGGYIYDNPDRRDCNILETNIGYCEKNYMHPSWVNVTI